MKVQLAYGTTGLEVEVPDHAVIVEPTFLPGLPDEDESLRRALREPIAGPPLVDRIRAGQTVAVAVCDVTRPMPSDRVLPVLLAELEKTGAGPINILVATGTHRPCSRDELVRMLGRDVVDRYQVLNHVSTDQESLVDLGVLDGIPILLNRHFIESDIRITTGFVEPHFFAGFSGGPKLVAPGLVGMDTILALHSAGLIGHPKSTWGTVEGNPIQEAIGKIASQVGVSFTLDVTLNRDHAITGVYAGDLFPAHRAACREVREASMKKLKGPFDIVVTTNSGYPLDLNLYQSVKGISAAARIVKEGGMIICAAECRDGIPRQGAYREILSRVSNPDEIIDMVSSPGFSCPDQWQAQVQALIQKKARVLVKSDCLNAESLREALFEPVEEISELLRRLEEDSPVPLSICVLPQGPQTIPYFLE